MSTVSSRFYVTAIDDGVTLHGNLQATKPLTQAWTGTAAVPNWEVAANQPIIFLTLLEGSTYVLPKTGYKWKYNGTEIDLDNDDRFERATYKPAGYTVNVPAIKIKKNLASSENVDIDLITFEGSYTIGGTDLDFSAPLQIRITAVTSNGLFGLINFYDVNGNPGPSTITEKGQTIYMDGSLYDGSGNAIGSGWTADFYINDTTQANKIGTYNPANPTTKVTLNESQVTDSANLIAVFSYVDSGATLTYIAYETIDDQQDPEMMYIQYNGANGNAASLHKGEEVEFNMFMATNTDPTPESGWNFKVKILDSLGSVVTGHIDDNIPDAGQDGWRPITGVNNIFKIKVTFAVSKALGKYLTGLVYSWT